MIEILMIKGDEDDEVDENLTNWEIASVSQKLIEIDLEFSNPLGVSQGQ